MKITINSKSQQQKGVALLISIIIMLFMASILATYLLLTENEFRSVNRSQSWNMSMTLSEAGVEEALACINQYEGNISMCTQWPAAALTNGWTVSNSVYYVMTRTVQTNMGSYTVTIDNTYSNAPVITSAGSANLSYLSSRSAPFMLAASGVTVASPAVSRTVQVKATLLPFFNFALAAKQAISFSGGAAVDSYNSANPNLSYWNSNNIGGNSYGLYTNNGSAFNPKRDQDGNVETDDKVNNSITGSGSIALFGHLNTGPGGSIGFNGNAAAGGTNWIYANNSGIQPGFSNDDMNVVFPDVQLPNYDWTQLGSSSTGISQAGDFEIAQISLSGQNKFSILAPTNSSYTFASPMKVVLYVTGSISMSGQGTILVGTNVNLTIYAAGSVSLSGNGLSNTAQYAPGVALWGLPTCTSFSTSGNGCFYGSVYAPEASASLSGGGSSGGFYGSIMANTISLTGGASVSFDEALENLYGTGFVPASWAEK